MIYDVYIKKLIESILNNYDSKMDNYICIKHYNVLGLSENDVRTMVGDTDDVLLMYHEFQHNKLQEPYEPFMMWIKRAYEDEFSSEMTAEEFIDKCDVYSVQKKVFTSYILNGLCERDDDVLVIELKYEKNRFVKSMLNILNYIASRKKIFMVLSKLHLSNYSTIEFILNLMQNKSIRGMGIIVTYNGAFHIDNYMNDMWEKFKDYIENNNLLYDWATLEKQKEELSENVFIPKAKAIDEYIININNMLRTFALEPAGYYLNTICQKIEFENLNVPIEAKLKIFGMSIIYNVAIGVYNNALLLCESFRELVDDDDYVHIFEYAYSSAIIFIYINQRNSAYACLEECKKTAKKSNNDNLIFKAKYLEHMINYNGWEDMYNHSQKYIADPEFIEECKKRNYNNALAYMYVFGVSEDNYYMDKLPKTFETLFIPNDMKKGLELIDKLGNDNLKITAYMNTIDFYRGLNNFKHIESIYLNCINILKKNDEKMELADLYNGIGYNSSIVEKYSQANEYYNEALKIFYEEGMPEKMGETIYNIAFNCMHAGEFAKGLEFILIAIEIIEELGLQGYRLCKNSKLYGLAALCNYYLGADYNCYMYLNKIERIIHHILENPDDKEINYDFWADDLFLYYFVSGVIAKKNQNMELALQYFDKAQKMINSSEAFKCFSYPVLTMEMAKVYKELNQVNRATQILDECIEYCEKNGYYEKKKKLLAERQNRKLFDNHKINDLYFKELSIDMIKECTKDYSIDQKLKARLNDINFLSRWQDRLDKDESELDDMITTSLKTIQNNFSFDRVLYFRMEKEGLELMFDSQEEEVSQNDINEIENYFVSNRTAFVASRIEKYFIEYEKIIKLFGINNVITIVGVPILDNENIDSIMIGLVFMHKKFYVNRKLLDESDLVIIKYVFGQFVDAVERIKAHKEIERINQKLTKIASTDLLTGLLNRQGFMNIIKSFDNKICDKTINTVLYIDLDNFKYYNDTVGHEMGDLILVLFSRILERCIEKDGYAVRYGGDEFILMLFGFDKEYAIEISKRIYSEIKSGFIEEMEEKLGRKVEIPDDKKISCCIGIADFIGYELASIEKALNQADEALYYVKKTTKHNYKVWDEELNK